MADPTEPRFTASSTAYMRNADRNQQFFAVHYQAPDRQLPEGGVRMSLRFPMLIVAEYVNQPEAVAEKVARILEKHWDDAEQEAPHG